MSECRICGNVLRDGEDATEVGGALVHHDCAASPGGPRRRPTSIFAAAGTRGQMGLGDVQRDDPWIRGVEAGEAQRPSLLRRWLTQRKGTKQHR